MSEELQQKLRNQLWAVANTLRGNMSASDFMYFTLGFIFYKYLSEKIELFVNEELEQDGISFSELWQGDDAQFKYDIREDCVNELGYFIPNKTAEQLAQEQELTYIFKKANADVCRMDDYQPLFLKADDAVSSYLLSRITDSPLFQGKYLTAHTVPGGILFYTKNPNQLEILLKSLIVR